MPPETPWAWPRRAIEESAALMPTKGPSGLQANRNTLAQAARAFLDAGYLIAEAGELAEARAEADRLREALQQIDALPRRWAAPLTHPVGDMSDPAYAGSAAWAAVGSEGSLIAHLALGGTRESARQSLEAPDAA